MSFGDAGSETVRYYLETPRGFDRLLPLREVHVLLCVSVVWTCIILGVRVDMN